MRVGIVTGEVAVTIGAEQQGMVAGDAVNTASRVQSAAAPGQVWVDETTRLLTTSAITYVDVGSHAMKGKADPVPLWAVRAVVAAVGGAQRADGLEAPLVGRDRELRLVKELFHGVEETGRPALLVVDGEPGVGKTRLGWEFEKYIDGLRPRCAGTAAAACPTARGWPSSPSPRRSAAGCRPCAPTDGRRDDGDEDQAGCWRWAWTTYVADADERAWLGPGSARCSASARSARSRARTSSPPGRPSCGGSARTSDPVVLVIDDAQHADDGLLQFLEHLLAVGVVPAASCCCSPGPACSRTTRAWPRTGGPPCSTSRRSRRRGHGRPAGRAGRRAARRRRATALVERAEGIPLFAVETVRSLIDRDLVVPRGGQYVLADPTTSTSTRSARRPRSRP